MKTKKFICEKCGNNTSESKLSSLEFAVGRKKIVVSRVAVKECQKCHHAHPTVAGTAKIDRCFGTMATMFGLGGLK